MCTRSWKDDPLASLRSWKTFYLETPLGGSGCQLGPTTQATVILAHPILEFKAMPIRVPLLKCVPRVPHSQYTCHAARLIEGFCGSSIKPKPAGPVLRGRGGRSSVHLEVRFIDCQLDGALQVPSCEHQQLR